MPRGVYVRTEAMREAIRQARLGATTSLETRKRQSEAMKKKACDPAWLLRVSEGTRKKMYAPAIRANHLKGLQRARKRHGVNFKGGKGQQQVPFVRRLKRILIPLGYVEEHSVVFGSHGVHYNLDFALALVQNKIAIECDGPKHRSRAMQERDKLRDLRLQRLGWKVIRVRYD